MENWLQAGALQSSLAKAELLAANKEGVQEVDVGQVLEIAKEECQFPELGLIWVDTLEPDDNGIQLCKDDDCVDPQAVGYAVVEASAGGHICCLRKLREIQAVEHGSSFLTGRFTAYAFMKAVEKGQTSAVLELLKPVGSASLDLLGYAIATKYRSDHYPFVNEPLNSNMVNSDWMRKLSSVPSLLPKALPTFHPITDQWELGLRGPSSKQGAVHEEPVLAAIRATYSSNFLWRAALVAASNNQPEPFQVLMKELEKDAIYQAETNFYDSSVEGRKIIAVKIRIDNLMYTLVEELCVIQFQDSILHLLWSHIQCGSSHSPAPAASRPHPNAKGTHCVAKAENGLWEVKVEVPLLLMPLEHSYVEEDASKRRKQLAFLFSQRADINIQLVAAVVKLPNCVEVTVGIKHVRYKIANSIWDQQQLGHFPCFFSLSVTPQTTEGAACTMTNSSSNIGFKVGTGERIQAATNITAFSKGLTLGIGASAGTTMSSTMKSDPWRFEQLPVNDDRGGSYIWSLQLIKGLEFNRFNPMRMAEVSRLWKFGRRVPVHPLAELPFTSEGGINFTSVSHDDTLMWRFPTSMDGKELRWTITGEFHSTFTTTRFWETRMAVFSGIIQEKLVALEVKEKDKDKKNKGEDGDSDEKKKKKEKKGKDEDDETVKEDETKVKKKDKDKKKSKEGDDDNIGDDGEEKKKKKEKKGSENVDDETMDEEETVKKKDKDKKSKEEEESVGDGEEKKKKKKKNVDDESVNEDATVKKKDKDKKSKEEDETSGAIEEKNEKIKGKDLDDGMRFYEEEKVKKKDKKGEEIMDNEGDWDEQRSFKKEETKTKGEAEDNQIQELLRKMENMKKLTAKSQDNRENVNLGRTREVCLRYPPGHPLRYAK